MLLSHVMWSDAQSNVTGAPATQSVATVPVHVSVQGSEQPGATHVNGKPVFESAVGEHVSPAVSQRKRASCPVSVEQFWPVLPSQGETLAGLEGPL
jgi:hypothetical protein